MRENLYLTEQIITYLGNKRNLLPEIKTVIDDIILALHKETKDIVAVDLFSGSGVVARLLKNYGFKVISNDLEGYSSILNNCYLSNQVDFDDMRYNYHREKIQTLLDNEDYTKGIITTNYAPIDDNNIQVGERAFYTSKNAKIIDTIRNYIDNIEEENKKFFLAPLLYEASVHTNTSGVFKGFYKDSKTNIGKFGGNGENALSRIKGEICIKKPVFSEKNTEYCVYQKDANILVKDLDMVDIMYIDPPYNQHPYASNYFMLNVIAENKLNGELSKVSGIPNIWNHSLYNKKQEVKNVFTDLIEGAKSRYIVVSYNSEGFITMEEISEILQKFGTVNIKEINYNTFRGSRNLKKRSKYVKEFIFILEKKVQ